MKNKTLTVKELATQIVGDGKKPNKYFVTIGYGWYIPGNTADDDMVQACNSLESVSLLFTRKEDAEECFNSIALHSGRIEGEVTGETIGQVMIEDRLNGVIKEKGLKQRPNGTFTIYNY